MPLEATEVTNVKFKGCPDTQRNIAFIRPDGSSAACRLKVPPTWDLSLFVEAEFHRWIMVATSPDGQALRIERWMSPGIPSVLKADTQAEQDAALGGKNAGNSTHAQLATAAFAQLTANDSPVAVPARTVDIVPMANNGGRDYEFASVQNGDKSQTVNLIRLKQAVHGLSMKTKAQEGQLVEAFRHVDTRDAFFLFDVGANYLLESLRIWGGSIQRREATAAKAPFAGTPNEDIVKAMAANLAWAST